MLLVIGADDERKIFVKDGQLNARGTSDIHGLLQGPEGKVPFHRLHITREFLRRSDQFDLSRYRTIVNSITEPEGNRRVLQGLADLVEGRSERVVNHPAALLATTRDQIAHLLAGVPGLIVPRVERLTSNRPGGFAKAIEQAGLTYPLIVRAPGTHTGTIVGRFDGHEQLPSVLDRGTEHLAIEFVDFAGHDGLYRKHRVFFIGRHTILRHMLVSDHWNVHAKDRSRLMIGRADLRAEEERLFGRVEGAFEPHVTAALGEVRSRVPLDFFGIDFGIRADGQAVLFEANASMSFFPFFSDPMFAYVRRSWAPARTAFRELVGATPAS